MKKSEAKRGYPIDVNYGCVFKLQPCLSYDFGNIKSMRMSRCLFQQFHDYVRRELDCRLATIYYVVGDSMEKGLFRIGNDLDVNCFFDLCDIYGKQSIYVDQWDMDDLIAPFVNDNNPLDTVVESVTDEEGAKLNDSDDEGHMGVEDSDVEGDKGVEDTDVEGQKGVEDTDVEGDKGVEDTDVEGQKGVEDTDVEGNNVGVFGDDDEDDDYEPINSDEDVSSIASLDNISEGEDELIQVRKENPIAVIPSQSQIPQFCPRNNLNMDDENEHISVDHEDFMGKLLKSLKNVR